MKSSETGCVGPPKLWPGSYGGLLTSLLATFLVSFFGVIVKYLDNIHPAQIVFHRALTMLVLVCPFVVHTQNNVAGPKGSRIKLVVRGFLGCNGMLLAVTAFKNLPLGDVAVITSCNPIIVGILARIFLKEACQIVKVVALGLTVIGLCLLAKVPELIAEGSTERFQEANYWWGFGAALGSTVFAASCIILLRVMRNVDESVITFNFAWVTTIETGIVAACLGVFVLPGCGSESLLLLLIGTINLAAQMLMAYALRIEQAGPVAIVRASARVFFSFIWQVVIFHEIPDAYSISAAVMVIGALALITVHKWWEGNHARKTAEPPPIVETGI